MCRSIGLSDVLGWQYPSSWASTFQAAATVIDLNPVISLRVAPPAFQLEVRQRCAFLPLFPPLHSLMCYGILCFLLRWEKALAMVRLSHELHCESISYFLALLDIPKLLESLVDGSDEDLTLTPLSPLI